MPKKNDSKSTPMTSAALSRIHSSEAKSGGGQVSKRSFTSRVQRTLASNQENLKGGSK